MATTNDKIKDLYDFLSSEGYDFMGEENAFREKLNDNNKVSDLYNFLQSEGYDFMGTQEDQSNLSLLSTLFSALSNDANNDYSKEGADMLLITNLFSDFSNLLINEFVR